MPRLERTITVDTRWTPSGRSSPTSPPPSAGTPRRSPPSWPPGPGGVGSVYRNVSKILGREVEIEYTVVDLEPRSLFRLSGQTSSMSMLDTMRFSETPTGTTVHYTVEFEPHGATKLAEPLMPLGLKKLGDDAATTMEAELSRL